MDQIVKKEIYVDGLTQIHFAGGMVRFDFMTLQPKEDGQIPEPQKSDRLIVPLMGFVKMYDSMQQLIDRLVEAKIVQRRQAP